jgi:hypothetical protein
MLGGKLGEVATTVDIQSVVAGHDAAGHEILRFRLNPYATALATEVAKKEGSLLMRLCLRHHQQTELFRDADDYTMFSYRLGDDREQAAQEKKCIAERTGLETVKQE